MPSVADAPSRSSYLPPLGECLSQRSRLISWSVAHEALTNPHIASGPVQPLLCDDQSIKAIATCLQPTKPGNGQTKADFDTRTSSTDIPTTSQVQPIDLEQIKSDSLWLAKVVDIHETTALRVVVLQWQNRPAAEILDGYNEEEALNGQQAAFASSTFLPGTSLASSIVEKNKDGRTSEQRRKSSILQTYFDERERLLAVAVFLETALVTDASHQTPGWVRDVAQKVADSRTSVMGTGNSPSDRLSRLTDAFERHLALLGGEPELKYDDAATIAFIQRCRLFETAHLLRLLFLESKMSSHLESIHGIAAWFRLMDTYGFLQTLEANDADQQPIVEIAQSLASLISVQLLNFPGAQSLLEKNSAPNAASWYMLDNECCRQLRDALVSAAVGSVRVAAPAMLCWSVLGVSLRENYKHTRRLSLDSDDGSRSPVFARSDGTAVGDALQVFADADVPVEAGDKETANRDLALWLAEQAIDKLDVFTLVAGLANVAGSLFAPGFTSYLESTVRQTLLDVIRQGSTLTVYGPEILGGALAVLRPRSFSADPTPTDVCIANEFLGDASLCAATLTQAAYRFPFELSPFLLIYEALSTATARDQDGYPLLTQRLRYSSSFTLQMPQNFNNYEVVRASNAENAVRLVESLELFMDSKPRASFFSKRSDPTELVLSRRTNTLVIPSGTFGRALNDTRPFVAMWEHEYSSFAYLASLLATALPSSHSLSVASQEPLPRDLQSSVVRVFISHVKLLLRFGNDSHDRVKLILEEASDNLPNDHDIVSIVGELLETELAAQPLQSDDASIDILATCISFFEAILPILPDRVWPQLARLGLVNSNDSGGKLGTVTASLEIASGRFSFLLACLELFDGLVKDVIQNAVTRVGENSNRPSRFQDAASTDPGIPEKMMGQLVESFTRLFLDVLRSIHDWRFADINEQLRINGLAIEIFKKIVTVVYGFDDTKSLLKKLSGPLAPAARLLVETHCSKNGGELSVNSLLRLSTASSEAAVGTITTTAALLYKQCDGALSFVTLLLDIGDLTGYTCVILKKSLFQAVPAMVRLYIGRPSQRLAIVKLLTSMINASAKAAEATSLFSHLSSESAQRTIAIFSDLGKPLQDENLQISIWKLFAAAVGGRQQWFSAFLLTGSVPHRSYKGSPKQSQTPSRVSVIDQALDTLCESDRAMGQLTGSILQFVVNSVNNWPWCVGRLKKHMRFIDSMCFRLSSLETKPRELTGDHAVTLAWQTQGVSLLSELLAMYSHFLRWSGDSSFFLQLADTVYFFKDSCVGDPSYATSLHNNLHRNLQRKLPHCSLASFKKLLPNAEFGSNYYYDLDFAREALTSHLKWQGAHQSSGFEEEFRRANNNLSLVEAQIQNLKSWKMLAVEFSAYAKESVVLQKKLAYVVHECLEANKSTSLEASVFENLAVLRAELALPLLQRLVDAQSEIRSMRTLLPLAWDVILATEQDFTTILSGKEAEYFRVLLRLLLLSLQPHAYVTSSAPVDTSDATTALVKEDDKVSVLLAITRHVVGKGFKSLCGQLHEQPYSVLPSDFSLLTTIFQTVMCVRTRELSGLEPRIASVLIDEDVARYATSLFSWSDRLTASNDDPIYGEISMLFLYEMSSIPMLAEMLAAEGALSRISTANVTIPFRQKNGSGPFDEPTRLFTIWSRGLLPICLNILVAAEGALTQEVASFLGNFQPQIERAGAALDPKGAVGAPATTAGRITLNTASEAHTLALIKVALEQSDVQDTLSGWDRVAVKQDIDVWIHGSRGVLRERIVPTTEKELSLQRMKPLGRDKELCGCESRLEEMVLHELKGAYFVLNGGTSWLTDLQKGNQARCSGVGASCGIER